MKARNENGEASEGVLAEVVRRLGECKDRPNPDVDLIYGYIWREAEGRWRLYRDLRSGDYLEGSDEDLGAERRYPTFNGDTILFVRVGAELVHYTGKTGKKTKTLAAEEPSTNWHTTIRGCEE